MIVQRVITQLLAVLLLQLSLTTPALAHKASDSFMYLNTDTGLFRIDVALRDLALMLPLDKNGDGKVTGAEFRVHRAEILSTVEAGIALSASGQPCQMKGRKWGLAQHSDGAYAAANYRIVCPDNQNPDQLHYNLLFEQDSLHRGLLEISTGRQTTLAVSSPDNQVLALRAAGTMSLWRSFGTFIHEGVLHLLIGLDHLLFLLVLVLPASLARHQATGRNHHWLPTRAQILELTSVVTAFTIAHSITLALAALNLVSLPIAWVETVIAASIIVAAINVAWPILGTRTWLLAFGFGLVHGFGFASVLSDLTTGAASLSVALVGFNVGVELGQLALLAVGFPLLTILARATPLYRQALVPLTLIWVAGISLIWVWERIPAA